MTDKIMNGVYFGTGEALYAQSIKNIEITYDDDGSKAEYVKGILNEVPAMVQALMDALEWIEGCGAQAGLNDICDQLEAILARIEKTS
jgi:hypothetical protein